ncbi:cytochrome c [Sphingomonas sp.]|uniref:c-type cytochrome n=1 Tax=Sphingomonas sp. TaxID=28214 RepID=UPI001D622D33|nr:cytochrome c [Sphingomonas sp.]MBX9797051.1 cytochrome c [Sphingomonas sp.]
MRKQMMAAAGVAVLAAGVMAGIAPAQQTGAQQAGAQQAAPATTTAPATTAETLVAARQAGFRLMGANFGQLRAAAARGDDVKPLAGPARAIAGWARAMPGLFPAGATTPKSEALPSVWSDRAGFETAAGDLAREAMKLSDLAKAGDTPGFGAQLQVVGGTCGACHKKFKLEEKK